eukprot:CAMPEP_0175406328 /NCGR_PEP_ID=MMETSP0095-20121207/39508_1 /TAXON_ID=311494 /ORGANISM="Alexandrium monilatum, Strain CCMP3105" /LENGTH=136 /DNA_ID=CAMNT_0016705187 /DNA_START=279 /DNA_END=685 /DNA_ORIENTATION=-
MTVKRQRSRRSNPWLSSSVGSGTSSVTMYSSLCLAASVSKVLSTVLASASSSDKTRCCKRPDAFLLPQAEFTNARVESSTFEVDSEQQQFAITTMRLPAMIAPTSAFDLRSLTHFDIAGCGGLPHIVKSPGCLGSG